MKTAREWIDRTETTSKPIQGVLTNYLKGIKKSFDDRPDLILNAWPELVGASLAPMTQAISFLNGILTVQVSNSSLLSLLSQQEKPRLLNLLRGRFPGSHIQNIVFRIG